MNPLLLIDVDGVLNAFYGGKASKGWQRHRVDGYTLYLNRKHGDWLTALAPDFELVWATTWEDQAPTGIAPLVGLPSDMAVIHFPPSDEPTWKLAGIRDYVGDRPCVWLDDDIGPDGHSWAQRRDASGTPTLFLDVDPRMGLLPHHIDKIRRWRSSL